MTVKKKRKPKRPLTTVIVGDVDLTDDKSLSDVSVFRQDMFLCKPLIPSTVLIDADLTGLTPKQFKWMLHNTVLPVVVRVSNAKSAALLKGVNSDLVKIQYGDVWGNKKDLFALLNAVVFNKDRDAVFKILEENTGALYIAVKFLISSIMHYPENADVLDAVDRYLLGKGSNTSISRMLAYGFKSVENKRRIFFKLMLK